MAFWKPLRYLPGARGFQPPFPGVQRAFVRSIHRQWLVGKALRSRSSLRGAGVLTRAWVWLPAGSSSGALEEQQQQQEVWRNEQGGRCAREAQLRVLSGCSSP